MDRFCFKPESLQSSDTYTSLDKLTSYIQKSYIMNPYIINPYIMNLHITNPYFIRSKCFYSTCPERDRGILAEAKAVPRVAFSKAHCLLKHKGHIHNTSFSLELTSGPNKTAHIRHQCRKIAVLSCHRCLIKTGVEIMNNI
jgi:hypothetical protein